MQELQVRSVRAMIIALVIGVVAMAVGLSLWIVDFTLPHPMAMLPASAYTTGVKAPDLAPAPDPLAIASLLVVGAGLLLVAVSGIAWIIQRRDRGPRQVAAK